MQKGAKMKEKLDIIIDADPGVDDAIAIMYALNSNNFNVKLICSAGGNAPIEDITANAIFLTELFEKEIPVAQGAKTPLKRPAHYAVGAQGKFGFGNFTYNRNALKHKPIEKEASEAMYDVLMQSKKPITILSVGPMTNIAHLLLNHSDCKKKIKQIVFESGTKDKIFGIPYQSFNVGYDPESAEIVFASGVPIVMVPMDLGHFSFFDKEDIKRIQKSNYIGKIYAKMFSGYKDHHVGELGAATHDATAIFYLAHPEFFKTEKVFIGVKYFKDDELDFGYINTNFDAKPNATICMDMDIDNFKFHMFNTFENKLDVVKHKTNNA